MATIPKEVPAPWVNMRAEAYHFFASSRASDVPPSAAYDPLELKSAFADPNVSGQFAGGRGSLMIVRYLESPCGPYDELLLIPGEFQVPVAKERGATYARVTRIYVSTAASVFNGRRNWNIPKRLADFTFVPRTDGYSGYARVEVRLPGEQKPFFAVDLTPSWVSLIELPLSTAYLPVKGMVQPPLPHGDEPERIGTDKWQAVAPYMRGKGSVVYASGGLENGEWSDGINMPPMNQFYSMGVQWRDFLLDFYKATDPAQ